MEASSIGSAGSWRASPQQKAAGSRESKTPRHRARRAGDGRDSWLSLVGVIGALFQHPDQEPQALGGRTFGQIRMGFFVPVHPGDIQVRPGNLAHKLLEEN